jgi:integrase
MTDAGASRTTRALAVQTSRDMSDSSPKLSSVRSAAAKQWQPPEGLAPDEILAIIDAASTERDRLLLRVLWATGARISEALDLRLMDVRRDSLVLPNLKNPSRPTKQVFLPAGQMDLPGALLLWAKEHGSPMASHFSSHASTLRVEGGGLSVASRRGKLCAQPPKERMYACWRCGARAMGRRVTPRRCIPIYSAMPACAR